MYARLAVVLVLAVAVICQALPSKKCAPSQWSADFLGSISQVNNGSVLRMTTRGKASVDYTKQMEALRQLVDVSGAKITSHLIMDYKQMVFHVISPMHKMCETRAMPSDAKLNQYCEGDDVNVVGSLTIGGKQAYTVEMKLENSTSYTTVMADTYLPVTTVSEETYNDMPQMVAYQYGNATAKIPDLSIFDIPSYCKKAQKKRVCGPTQLKMEGLGQLGQVAQGVPMSFELHMTSYRDYKDKKEASFTNVTTSDGDVIRRSVVTHWDKQKVYDIDLDNNKCTVLPTPVTKMIEMCSDSDELKLISSFLVDGKMADMYTVDMGEVQSTFTVFRDTFEIISSVIDQTFDKIPQMLVFQYGNITEGIKNPKVFDLPAICSEDDTTIG